MRDEEIARLAEQIRQLPEGDRKRLLALIHNPKPLHANSQLKDTLRRSGPCLRCSRPTIYGTGTKLLLANAHYCYGDEWLDRVVARGWREDDISFVGGSETVQGRPFYSDCWVMREFMVVADVNGASYPRTIKPYLCAACRAALEALALEESHRNRMPRTEMYRCTVTSYRCPECGEGALEGGQIEQVTIDEYQPPNLT